MNSHLLLGWEVVGFQCVVHDPEPISARVGILAHDNLVSSDIYIAFNLSFL